MAYAKLIIRCKLHQENCSQQCYLIHWMKYWLQDKRIDWCKMLLAVALLHVIMETMSCP